MSHPIVPTDPGVTRQVLAHSPEMMTVAFRFAAGAEGKPHDHRHLQATYVESGHFTFHVAGKPHELRPGDSLVIASHVRHGCTCREAGTLIDTFAPRRDDFL